MRFASAGAPVSFGVFEMTDEDAATVQPDDMLEVLAEAGYHGVDLGPVGFLGRGHILRRRLSDHGLDLAGGWVQLPMSDDDAFEASLPELRDALRIFQDAAEAGPERMPLPTLADSGSVRRAAAPGRGDGVDALAEHARDTLHRNAERAADIVRAAGFEPTFHHHAGTFVESPDEIDRFLANVDIGLTLDSGHLCIAGGDPVQAMVRWGARINHLHLKDVDVEELDRIIAAGGGMREIWSSRSFVAFGEGHVPVEEIMTAAETAGFSGWVVVEQDVLPAADVELDGFLAARARDQYKNRAALAPWFAGQDEDDRQ